MMPHARPLHLDGRTYHWQNRRNPWNVVIELEPGKFLTVSLTFGPESEYGDDWESHPAITPGIVKEVLAHHLAGTLEVGTIVSNGYKKVCEIRR